MFNPWTFLFEALNFVVLAYVLYRLLYRPLQQAVEQRREANARAEAEAHKAREEAAALQQRLEEEIAQRERERQETLHRTREQAEAERQHVLAEAERAVQRRQEEVREALDREREEALQALRGEVIGQAVDLAERLLREAADSSLHRQLTLRLVEALRALPEAERARVRGDWRAEDGVMLESAQELDEATATVVAEAASEVVGRAVTPVVQIKPALLAGARLVVGGHLWDASAAGQLSEAGRATAEGVAVCRDGSSNSPVT